MAAACTINEAKNAIVPLIQSVQEEIRKLSEPKDKFENLVDHIDKTNKLIEDLENSVKMEDGEEAEIKKLFIETLKDNRKKIILFNEQIKKTLKTSKTNDTRCFVPEFYNLTLNRTSDISDKLNPNKAIGYLLPIGSLLEFIDNHYEKPEMRLDRTMGKEVNLLSSLHDFDEIKDHVHFKSFDRLPHSIPAKHGDFNECPFWRKEFWGINESYSRDVLHRNKLLEVNCWDEDWYKKEEGF